MLAEAAKRHKFRVKIFAIVKSGGTAVSSTQIRKLIRRSRIRRAGKLLGRPVSVLGRVVKGSRLGQILGFPTANILPAHEVVPPAGIYCARIIFAGKKYPGICYIGTRPTLSLKNNPLRIEAHIFDFNKNIYGQMLEVQFLKFIRPDKKFSTLARLTAQIRKDIAVCRKIQ